MSDGQAYLAADLWYAMGGNAEDFVDYYERNGWANTWAALLQAIRVARGAELCAAFDPHIEGPCVLMKHNPSFPHYGASDVGRGEPLPFTVRSLRG